jgi:hypothetical protein
MRFVGFDFGNSHAIFWRRKFGIRERRFDLFPALPGTLRGAIGKRLAGRGILACTLRWIGESKGEIRFKLIADDLKCVRPRLWMLASSAAARSNVWAIGVFFCGFPE